MLSGESAVAELLPDDQLFGERAPASAAENYAGQARTPADALLPRERPAAVVAGMLNPGGLYIPYSSPGQLKTLLFTDLGYSVALGRPWLPGVGKDTRPGFAVRQCPVVWIDQDNGPDVMDERMAAMARAYGVTDAPFYCLSFPEPGIAASRGLTAITRYVQSVGAGLVVFDNLLRIAGVRDENAAEVDVAMTNLRLFAKGTGAATVVIHHRRKDTMGREGDSIRGHSSIEAALDAAFLITRPDGGNVVQVKCTKARRKPVDPFAALWTYEHAADGETLHAARFWRGEVADKRQQAMDDLRVQILASLEGGEKNTTQLLADVHGRKAEVVSLLGQMHLERAILCEAGARGAKVYRLP